MYDFYPEWGPSRNRDEAEQMTPSRRRRYWQALPQEQHRARVGAAVAVATRDDDRGRPDDN